MKILRLIIIISLFGTVILTAYYVMSREDIYQREKAAGADFNQDTYRGMARFGLGRLAESFVRNEDLKSYDDFKFGWFHNWGDNKNYFYNGAFPVSIPKSIDFYGLVAGYGTNTTSCPESLKNDFKVFKDGDVIWIGNEIGWDDNRDPNTYAHHYKSWYDCVKSVNPNIKVVPGANPGNPLMKYSNNKMNTWNIKEDPKGRWSVSNNKQIDYIEYIRYAKADYKEIYGADMPIDAYVIHIYGDENRWHDINLYESVIRAFRQYMKESGQQKLHLYIKEMGILPDNENNWEKNGNTMVAILNMLLNLKDSNIGNPNDNYRLVQRWAWYVGPVGCTQSTSYDSCLWKYTGFFHCHKVYEDPARWNCDCTTYREETPLGQRFKQYVLSIWGSYDSIPPNKPDITYTINGNNALVSFNSSDNGRINDYEISVGTSEGKSDVMLWTSTDTKTNYTIDNVVGKYVNVKSIDDGYNSSEVSSKKIEQISDMNAIYDIAPKGSPDGKINILDLTMVLSNWKWKKELKDNEADVNGDGNVNMLDISIIINNWTKKY